MCHAAVKLLIWCICEHDESLTVVIGQVTRHLVPATSSQLMPSVAVFLPSELTVCVDCCYFCTCYVVFSLGDSSTDWISLSACLSVCQFYACCISRIKRPRKPRIDGKVVHVMYLSLTSFEVKDQGHKVIMSLMYFRCIGACKHLAATLVELQYLTPLPHPLSLFFLLMFYCVFLAHPTSRFFICSFAPCFLPTLTYELSSSC